jgi:hypothetical protein
MKIKHAEFQQMQERRDILCADVQIEVEVEGGNRSYIAVFTEARVHDYDLTMLLLKEADLDLDWYDNDMHSAYKDVLESRSQNDNGETMWQPREELKTEILNYGNVREQLGKHFIDAKAVRA